MLIKYTFEVDFGTLSSRVVDVNLGNGEVVCISVKGYS